MKSFLPRVVGLGEGLSSKLRSAREIGFAVLFSCASAAILLAKLPYGFETNDQFQYLLLPYRDVYAPFLTGDWFTWETTHYHPSFAYLIRSLHFLFGEKGFPTSVFVVHVLGLCALGYACLRAARAMKLHPFSAAVAVLVVAFIRRLGIGESIVNHGLLLPADLALPFLVIGFADWMEDRRLRAGLMLGLSGLIHANFAVIGPLVIAIPEIAVLVRTRKPLPSLKLALGFLLLAWPSLVLAAMGFFAADTAPGAIRILFEYRSPHHYDPPLVNGPAIYWPLVLLAASMPVWLSRKAAGAKSANALVLVLALVLSQLVAAIATALGSAALVRLFLWRLSIPLILLSAIAFGEVLVNAVRRHRPFDIAFGLSAALLVLAFATNGAVQFTPQVSLRGFGMLIPFASCLAVSAIACRIEHAIFKYAALGLAAIPFVAAGLFSTPLVESKSRIHWAEAAERALTLKMPSSKEIRGERPSLAVLSWIEKHTPKEAKFLAPPGLDGFRLEARRAVFVDWKCCPMKGEEIAEWERRMKAVMGTKSLPAKGFALHRTGNSRYFARSLKSLAALARKEGLTFILARPSDKVPKDLEKIVTQGPWSVYRVL